MSQYSSIKELTFLMLLFSTGTTVYIERGDKIQISGVTTGISGSGSVGVPLQDERIIKYLNTSTSLETNIYSGEGINEDLFRPVNIIKQKDDKIIDNTLVTKEKN